MAIERLLVLIRSLSWNVVDVCLDDHRNDRPKLKPKVKLPRNPLPKKSKKARRRRKGRKRLLPNRLPPKPPNLLPKPLTSPNLPPRPSLNLAKQQEVRARMPFLKKRMLR